MTTDRAARPCLMLLALIALIVASLTVSATTARADELGPTPQECDACAPASLCFYPAVSGADTFNLGGHILHVGQKVTGTYRWLIGGQGSGEEPAVGSVSVAASGPGLKLLDCDGKRSASNSAAAWVNGPAATSRARRKPSRRRTPRRSTSARTAPPRPTSPSNRRSS